MKHWGSTNWMDSNRKLLLVLLTAALFGFAGSARANVASADTGQVGTGIPALAQLIAAEGRSIVQAQISDAAHDLEQAARQRDFASNAHELALLQWAHEDLAAAAKALHGVERTRTIDLLADLDLTIRRASTHLGPLLSPDGDLLGPLPPSRNQLARLAKEAQDLERNAAVVPQARHAHPLPRPLIGHRAMRPVPLPRPRPVITSAMAGEDSLSWPLGTQAAWLRAKSPL
jgi:hypothetical protein